METDIKEMDAKKDPHCWGCGKELTGYYDHTHRPWYECQCGKRYAPSKTRGIVKEII
jgi:hypothetical protein